MEEKVNTGPWNSKSVTNGPWVKSLKKLQVWSLKFQVWQKWPLEIQNLEKSIIVLVILKNGKNDPCENFGQLTIHTPQLFRIYKVGPYV